MNRSVINKILLARRLLDLAHEHLNSTNDLSLGIGVNMLQDSVEAFLLAVSEHVNAGVKAKTAFEQYFDLIGQKIAPKELPFRTRLSALNKLRVNSKHYGLVPAKSETEGLVVTVREFFEEVAKNILGVALASISLIDLLRDGEAKTFLKEAQSAFLTGNYADCLIYCRKAIFVRFESLYDIAPFAENENAPFYSRAPIYAQTKNYTEKNVDETTDYIVLDHSDLEIELITNGIDVVSFWNVWRLTPDVYQDHKGKEWVVKNDLDKLASEGITERAEYVLDTTISLFLCADQKSFATRSPDYSRRYYVNLRRDQVPIYKKADAKSEVIGTTPAGLKRIFVDYSIVALNGEGLFWHVAHFEEEYDLWGFIQDEEVAE